ncbi:MAG: Mn-containing catalase, partial [Rhizobacter sp.]|nr:Mn-containing catalase [Rhizobacter sp.]
IEPNVPPGKLPPEERFKSVYFNMSQGAGDLRGSWNSDANFEFISEREQQEAVDGGDGLAHVTMTEEESNDVENMAMRTQSDPEADPVTGAELGAGLDEPDPAGIDLDESSVRSPRA